VTNGTVTTVFDVICLATVQSANFNFAQLKLVRNFNYAI